MSHAEVVRLARETHDAVWEMTGDASKGTVLANETTRQWQDDVLLLDNERYEDEHEIAEHLNERIDLVDLEEGIAYELKVSPYNDRFEFFKDVFKVLVAKDHALPEVETFCFICPQETADKYEAGLRLAVLNESERLGFDLIVEGI